VDSVEGK